MSNLISAHRTETWHVVLALHRNAAELTPPSLHLVVHAPAANTSRTRDAGIQYGILGYIELSCNKLTKVIVVTELLGPALRVCILPLYTRQRRHNGIAYTCNW
jgi:hypothetical protein